MNQSSGPRHALSLRHRGQEKAPSALPGGIRIAHELALYGGGHCAPEINLGVGRWTARLLPCTRTAHLLSKSQRYGATTILAHFFGHHESFVQGNGVPGRL